MSNSILEKHAKIYADIRQIKVTFENRLGFGTDGYIWKTSRKTAVKVFPRKSTYEVESEVYRRLRQASMTEIDGFAIPHLVDFDDVLFVVEMSIVSPPFLLDFGKVDLDARTDYPDEVLIDTEIQCEEWFGDRWPRVKSALAKLEPTFRMSCLCISDFIAVC